MLDRPIDASDVGKKFRANNGDVVTILRHETNFKFPEHMWRAEEGGTYRSDGNFDPGDLEGSFDLVERLDEPPAPATRLPADAHFQLVKAALTGLLANPNITLTLDTSSERCAAAGNALIQYNVRLQKCAEFIADDLLARLQEGERG